MLQVYTGTGKGKTTAALGVALRGCGHNLKTVMFSFLKDDPEYGEAKAYKFLPGFILHQVGRDAFVDFHNPDPRDLAMCLQGWKMAQEVIKEGKTDIVILDELNIVLCTKMLPLEEVISFLKQYRHKLEIITTGRAAPPELLKIADLVTDMHEVKHYFHKGVMTRTGIDH